MFPRFRFVLSALAVVAGLVGPALAGAAESMYSCIDSKGRRITSDRPIRECLDREQRVLNRDGSERQVLPPSMTSDERAAAEEAERRRQIERAARADAARRDRNLIARFPDEASHLTAREAALAPVRKAIAASEKRLSEMEKDRQPLLTETEFYKGRELPTKLRTQLEFIDVTVDAQKSVIQSQQAELKRINDLYDAELARLRQLWAGAKPGSLGAPGPDLR